ncbi:arylalkylamine N-acetyltransferase-like 2 [Drosophila kikkawai]|uniref:aralkylamine N-acetyltransferase n=1 Tax=Drosophila kikkawai TaxID=30033 RepID=A0A6P4I2I0_DROKI|nr:dopamine N-acetyltransferase [Drosophila kikkawai]
MTTSADIKVRQVTASEADRLMTFLLEHYYREEPLTAGTSPPEPTADDKEFLLSNIPYGTCFLAEAEEKEDQGNDSRRIVGAVVAGPKDAGAPELMRQEAAQHAGSKWGRILDVLSAAENGSDVCRRFSVPSSLHVHALGVNSELRGQALGARLMEAVAQKAREQGHRLVSVDCTSVYSARLVQRLGYELVHTLRYADHLDASGQQVVTPPPPHESIQTFVLRL